MTRRAQDADLTRWARYLAAVSIASEAMRWSEEPAAWSRMSWGLIEGFLHWQVECNR